MYGLEHELKGVVSHGISTYAGYGLEIVMRNVLSVVEDDIILIIPPGCAALFSGCDIETSVKVAGYQCNPEDVASTAAGVKTPLLAQGNDHTMVIGFVGDGATVDTGVQALSGAMERRNRILYICYGNEAYMNTGIQDSSSTPIFASTTTTLTGERTVRRDLVGIVMTHDIPYAAIADISNPADLRGKVQEARDTQGPSLIHIHAPCPTGRRYASSKIVGVTRKAIQTGCQALYEYEDGRTTINCRPKELEPTEEYISLQGRFKNMTEDGKVLVSASTENHFGRLVKRLDDMNA